MLTRIGIRLFFVAVTLAIVGGAAAWIEAQTSTVAPSSGSGGGDGTLLDGVSSSIKATVRDYTNSNPLAVVITNTDGDSVAADVAHDAPDSGAPVPVGFTAETALSGITTVADGDRTKAYAGVDGVLFVRPHTGLEDIVVGNASNTDGASHELLAAAGVGIKQYLTSVTCTNTSTTGIYIELKSGTTVRYRLPVPAAAASDTNGVTKEFQIPLSPNAANEAWNVDGSAAVTTLFCSMIGFKSKV